MDAVTNFVGYVHPLLPHAHPLDAAVPECAQSLAQGAELTEVATIKIKPHNTIMVAVRHNHLVDCHAQCHWVSDLPTAIA